MINCSFNKKYAFTLAEVLITLGIIGVVAALTIPTLMNKVNKDRDYNAMKKAYSTISDAASRIRADNANSMADIASDDDSFAALFKPYLHILKSCNSGDSSCYSVDSVKNLEGGNFGNLQNVFTYQSTSNVIVSDGMVYLFHISSSACNGDKYQKNGENQYCGNVTIDVNGVQKPNTYGKDIFAFSINKYNVTPYRDMPAAIAYNDEYSLCKQNSSDEWNGADCTYRAIADGGIYYY